MTAGIELMVNLRLADFGAAVIKFERDYAWYTEKPFFSDNF